MLPADLTYRERAPLQRRPSISCSNTSVSVLCSNCLSYVNLVVPGKAVSMLCPPRFLLASKGGIQPVRPSVLRRGEGYVVFSLPSINISRSYVWYLLSVTYRVGLALAAFS